MSNVLGIGTDIVYIPRIAGLLQRSMTKGDTRKLQMVINKFMAAPEKQKLLKMVGDLNDPSPNNKATAYTAGVWATKESLLKALGCFVPAGSIPPAQTVYSKLFYKTNTETGRPIVHINNKFGQENLLYNDFFEKYINNKVSIDLSISHDKDYLISYCLIKSNAMK
ncbi:holo-[acyl-carrier-protein] synthase [Maudiozyma humilis]|uniref:Holo-[acyl-carrier-protein] synthase n=1 Tax=Maudiozyma humilis TaxID=51915 RepID=A0AAV5RZR3_MAUHU|nr:holo-[acyl-carrier-protein] synthase [Kazachstania humilis]